MSSNSRRVDRGMPPAKRRIARSAQPPNARVNGFSKPYSNMQVMSWFLIPLFFLDFYAILFPVIPESCKTWHAHHGSSVKVKR